MRRTWMTVSLLALTMAAAGGARAAPIVLNFEGVGDLASVDQFYNGGTDSQGHSGPNFGVEFSGPTLGLVDFDAGGHGNFANEPSPNTIMFFTDANQAILNYAAGFTTGFSFFYTSSTAASIDVYDGLNGTGNVLATLQLDAQFNQNCIGDPNGLFCRFSPVGVSFGGTAKSVNFAGSAALTGFDDITFGSSTPGGEAVPEPAAWALMIGGMGLAGAALRSRRSRMLA